MATKKITVVLNPSENGYVAYMPLFPGCTTQGDTPEEAFRMAQESLELSLFEPDEFDLWALDAYSDEVVVGTVEIEFQSYLAPTGNSVKKLRNILTGYGRRKLQE